MFLKVNYRTKHGSEPSVEASTYITTRKAFMQELEYLKKKYSGLVSSNHYLIDGSVDINMNYRLFGKDNLILGKAEKVESFRAYKNKIKCNNCKMTIVEWYEILKEKLPKQLKETIGLKCGKCTSVNGEFNLIIKEKSKND